MVLTSKQAGLNVRQVNQRVLPEHLIRPPIDILLAPVEKPKKRAHDQRQMSPYEKKKEKEQQKAKEEKAKKMEMCKQYEDDFFKACQEKISKLKIAAETGDEKIARFAAMIASSKKKEKRLTGFKFLFNDLAKPVEFPTNVSKPQFLKFAKQVKQVSPSLELSESQLAELFTYFLTQQTRLHRQHEKQKMNKATGGGKDTARKKAMNYVKKLRAAVMNKAENEKKEEETKKKRGQSAAPSDLEMDILNQLYEAYVKKSENLSGVLNTKNLGKKNQALKKKVQTFGEMGDLREKGSA